MNNDLILYIKTQLAKGATRSSIASELLQTGWKQQDIEAGFQTINDPTATKPSRISYRVSANLVDSIILGIPAVLIIFILNVLGFHINLSSLNQISISQKDEAIKSLYIVFGFVLYAVSVIYYVLCHVNKGASIGKSVYGLRLVQYKTNNTLTYMKAIPRELIKNGISLIPVVGGLIYLVNGLITLFSNEKRGLHDIVADSQVIEVTKPWSLGKQALYFIPLLIIYSVLSFILFFSLFNFYKNISPSIAPSASSGQSNLKTSTDNQYIDTSNWLDYKSPVIQVDTGSDNQNGITRPAQFSLKYPPDWKVESTSPYNITTVQKGDYKIWIGLISDKIGNACFFPDSNPKGSLTEDINSGDYANDYKEFKGFLPLRRVKTSHFNETTLENSRFQICFESSTNSWVSNSRLGMISYYTPPNNKYDESTLNIMDNIVSTIIQIYTIK